MRRVYTHGVPLLHSSCRKSIPPRVVSHSSNTVRGPVVCGFRSIYGKNQYYIRLACTRYNTRIKWTTRHWSWHKDTISRPFDILLSLSRICICIPIIPCIVHSAWIRNLHISVSTIKTMACHNLFARCDHSTCHRCFLWALTFMRLFGTKIIGLCENSKKYCYAEYDVIIDDFENFITV